MHLVRTESSLMQVQNPVLPYVAITPAGVEFFVDDSCGRPTIRMDVTLLHRLLKDVDQHRHPTVREMQAVNPE